MRRRILIFVSAVCIFILVAAGFFTYKIRNPGPYVCKTERYVYCGDPSELKLEFRDVTFKSEDGLELSAWYIPAYPAALASFYPVRPGIVVVHGRGVDRHEGMRFASALHAAGFNLLYIDLRNCGKSQKSFNSMSYYERRDVRAAVDYLVNQERLTSIGVFGFSMGAASSIHAMADDPRIKAGIFEGGFADFSSIVPDAAWEDYNVPRYPLYPIVRILFQISGGLNTDEISPVQAIERISPRPVFIIHGTMDRRVPYSHGQRLYAAAKDPKWLWTVPAGTHTSAWQADQFKAEALTSQFFLKYLEPAAP